MPIELPPQPAPPVLSVETPATPMARTVDPACEERRDAWRHGVAVREKLRIVAIAAIITLVFLELRLFGGAL
ncbi:MAG: hypothetical protein HYX76_12275 [Acidobacteria bacterium]|nr:hypothetical protein [Acidobacteriota bacterium]